ncbi:MAG: hypothetical protein KIT20_14515 [Alphaproteobacteria bacterium]|nr:hypothetical protein [Alphaproteobacteria bacterium]
MIPPRHPILAALLSGLLAFAGAARAEPAGQQHHPASLLGGRPPPAPFDCRPGRDGDAASTEKWLPVPYTPDRLFAFWWLCSRILEVEEMRHAHLGGWLLQQYTSDTYKDAHTAKYFSIAIFDRDDHFLGFASSTDGKLPWLLTDELPPLYGASPGAFR